VNLWKLKIMMPKSDSSCINAKEICPPHRILIDYPIELFYIVAVLRCTIPPSKDAERLFGCSPASFAIQVDPSGTPRTPVQVLQGINLLEEGSLHHKTKTRRRKIMINKKRLTIATLGGLACGFICFGLASGGPGELPLPVALQIIASRTLIGFTIGVSLLKLAHWSVHGIVMGLLISLPLAFSGLMAPENPEFSKTSMFAWTIVLGMIYGFLIELVTSVLFKAKMEHTAAATIGAAAAH
jgi:hypothetical protein